MSVAEIYQTAGYVYPRTPKSHARPVVGLWSKVAAWMGWSR